MQYQVCRRVVSGVLCVSGVWYQMYRVYRACRCVSDVSGVSVRIGCVGCVGACRDVCTATTERRKEEK